MKKTVFYLCETCGNIITKVVDSKVPVVCCGKPMTEMIPQTADATNEKHVPVIEIDGHDVTVTVGSTLHPMAEAHYIAWIYLETTRGGQFYYLNPEEQPVAKFRLADGESVIAAYEYCNVHGLWKA